jgi:hypothetical protein
MSGGYPLPKDAWMEVGKYLGTRDLGVARSLDREHRSEHNLEWRRRRWNHVLKKLPCDMFQSSNDFVRFIEDEFPIAYRGNRERYASDVKMAEYLVGFALDMVSRQELRADNWCNPRHFGLYAAAILRVSGKNLNAVAELTVQDFVKICARSLREVYNTGSLGDDWEASFWPMARAFAQSSQASNSFLTMMTPTTDRMSSTVEAFHILANIGDAVLLLPPDNLGSPSEFVMLSHDAFAALDLLHGLYRGTRPENNPT